MLKLSNLQYFLVYFFYRITQQEVCNMVEELEQLTQRVNNRSTRGANLEVKLSAHTMTQCASTTQYASAVQPAPCGLTHIHLCQMDFACAVRASTCWLSTRSISQNMIVLHFKGKKKGKIKQFFRGTKIEKLRHERREKIHSLGTLSSIFFHTSCFLFVLVTFS